MSGRADPSGLAPLDVALGRIARHRLEYGGGLADHSAMVVEALDHIARSEAILPWLDGYEPRLDPGPLATGAPLPDEPWDALGDPGAAGAWLAHLDARLAREPWTDVLADAVARLAPGAWAAAGHGLLRTAHAARGLGRADTAERRHELARGLTLWATTFALLPGSSAASAGARSAEEVLASVPLVPADRRTGWLITDRLEAIEPAPFVDAVLAVDLPDDVGTASLALAEIGARLLLADPGGATIALVHTVTVPAALPLLADGLPARARRALVHGTWVGVAALHAAFSATAPTGGGPAPDGAAPPWGDLLGAAVAGGEEHVVKLTVAARDLAHRGADDAVLRSAAALAAERLARP